MSITTTYPFTTPANYTYDSGVIEVTGGVAKLIDLRPANATCFATFDSSINLSWGDGTLTGTAVGGAAIVSNRLNLQGGGVKYVDYSATSNANSAQTGCIRFKLTPNYSGAPATSVVFYSITKLAGARSNDIELGQLSTTGNIQLKMYDSVGTAIGVFGLAAWLPTAGTTYEIEFNYDLTGGTSRLFIDGIQHDSDIAASGTRDTDIGLIRLGSDYTGASVSDFEIEDFIVYSTVQHTAGYTPIDYVVEKYSTTNPVICPSGTISAEGLVSFAATEITTGSDSLKYTIEVSGVEMYWSGTAWATSTGFAQSNTAVEINTNAAALITTVNTIKVLTYLHSDDNLTTPSIDLLTVVYDFASSPDIDGPECIVYCFIDDLLQDITDFTSLSPSISITNPSAFPYGNKIILAQTHTSTFNAIGYAELSILETTTVSKLLDITMSYKDNVGTRKTITFTSAAIPNSETANLLSFTSPTGTT